MIYGKIWLYVKPSTGIPFYLGAVAVASFAVHLAIVTNTTWVKGFLGGGQKAAVTASADVVPTLPGALTVKK